MAERQSCCFKSCFSFCAFSFLPCGGGYVGVSRPQQLRRSEDNLEELMSPPSMWAPVIKLRAPNSSWRQGPLPAELSLWPLLGFLRPGFVIQPQAGLYPLAFLILQLPGVQKSQACTIIPYSALLKILSEELEIQ